MFINIDSISRIEGEVKRNVLPFWLWSTKKINVLLNLTLLLRPACLIFYLGFIKRTLMMENSWTCATKPVFLSYEMVSCTLTQEGEYNE